ncbi:hypothetical protein [Streptomyces sp. SLBN-31]|uniref:hypothetical protein n=1 Tax=Streptomyces sp. SLBN-31 TaxID=2768444 RepID=UPI0021B40F3E|nr:hypothetical protein [Streptomyces sp. SLBN-31]
MSRRPLKAALTVAVAAAFSLAAVPAQAAPDPAPSVWTGVADTYVATARYAHEGFAKDGRYVPVGGCDAAAEGGADYRYVNLSNVGSLDPGKPAALIYADRFTDEITGMDGADAGRRLVAVSGSSRTPAGPRRSCSARPSRRAGLSGYFTLRAWLYEPNDNGLFAAYNPRWPAGACPAHGRAPAPSPGTGARRDAVCGSAHEDARLTREVQKYCGATPSTSVTTTPSPIAVIVSGDGTATVGPSGLGSLKNISTITRM